MHFSEQLFVVQAHSSQWVIFITAFLALMMVLNNRLWLLARNGITVVHEGGHALVAILCGRQLSGIKLHSDTSGVTASRGKPTGFGMICTVLAGYIAPSLVGLCFAALLQAGYVTLVLWIFITLLVAVLIMIRNIYGALLTSMIAILVFLISYLTSIGIQAIFAYLLTWFLLFGGIRPIPELQRKRQRGKARGSDADQLALLTGLPGTFWVSIFFTIAMVSLFLGGSWLLDKILEEGNLLNLASLF